MTHRQEIEFAIYCMKWVRVNVLELTTAQKARLRFYFLQIQKHAAKRREN